MRRTLLPFVLVFLAVVSCGRPQRRAENEILFSLSQTPTSADARWEFLTLSRGGQVREEFDDECYYEPLDERRGALHVDDGVATWKAPLVPDDGLVLSADRTHAHVDHSVWATGDILSFDARGFAMPDPKPVSFEAPPIDLEVIAPVAGTLDVSADRDLEILWRQPSRADQASVLVQLDSDSDDRVICFFPAALGHGTVPGGLLHVLRARSRSKEGTLKVATHRQKSIPGPGLWFIYVVASHVARTQAFRLN